MNRTPFSLNLFSLVWLLLLSSVVSGEPLSFSEAKKELVRLYKSNPDAKTFYCGCTIEWEEEKGVPNSESCGYTLV